MNRAFSLLILAILTACSTQPQPVDNAATTAKARSALLPLTIRAAQATHRFSVEVAATPQQQEQGLMFRKSLDADGGMLFPMDPPRIASFWMKNTLIPLDMLFIRTDGTIAFIGANTVPYSREPVSTGTPVIAVLELRGGRAAELGIAEGDRVQWGQCAVPAQKVATNLNFCPAPPR